MKRYLLFSVLTFAFLNVHSQCLVKVTFAFNNLQGHGVEMFFLSGDYHEVKRNILSLDTLTERKLLKVFGCPLVYPKTSERECALRDTLSFSYDSLFQSNAVERVEVKTTAIALAISFLKVSVDHCDFRLHNKYWGSYDVNFKTAAVLTSRPVILAFSKPEHDELIAFCKDLKKIGAIPVLEH